MRRGRLRPKHMSCQCSVEMSIIHVLPQIWWQGVPHTRTGSRETSVTEAVVVCVERHRLRCRSELRAASVGSKLNVEVSYVGVCPANDWCTRHASLNSTLRRKGSQCSIGSVVAHLLATRLIHKWSEPYMPLLPSDRASPHYDRYLFSVPLRTEGWVCLDGCNCIPRLLDRSGIQYYRDGRRAGRRLHYERIRCKDGISR